MYGTLMLLRTNRVILCEFYLGQMNVSRSIILYLNSLEERVRWGGIQMVRRIGR